MALIRKLERRGQSALIPGAQGTHYGLAKRAGFKVRTRREGPDLYRVWRLTD